MPLGRGQIRPRAGRPRGAARPECSFLELCRCVVWVWAEKLFGRVLAGGRPWGGSSRGGVGLVVVAPTPGWARGRGATPFFVGLLHVGRNSTSCAFGLGLGRGEPGPGGSVAGFWSGGRGLGVGTALRARGAAWGRMCQSMGRGATYQSLGRGRCGVRGRGRRAAAQLGWAAGRGHQGTSTNFGPSPPGDPPPN